MKALSVVYASRERGMECVFISKKLKKFQSKFEEEILTLVLSSDDKEGYVLKRFGDHIMFGKVTRNENSRFDSRPTNVYHFFFLTDEQYVQLRKEFCGAKEVVFISNPEADTQHAEQIRLISNERYIEEKIAPQRDDYCLEIMFFNLLSILLTKRTVRVCNNCDWENKDLFYYLNIMFPLNLYQKTVYLVGCQSYYGEATGWEKNKLVVCKMFLMNEEAALLSQMCYDPNDLLLKYVDVAHFYKLNIEERKDLFDTSFISVLKGQALGNGRYEDIISTLENQADSLKGKKLADYRRRKKLKKAIKALEKLENN